MTNLQEKKYWIWISYIKGLGIHKLNNLLKKYSSLDKIYKLKKEELVEIKGISNNLAQNITNINIKANINNVINYMQKNFIDIITIEDNDYPKILKQIYDPPICLYIKGKRDILNKRNIAMVGCRNSSEYGKKAAYYFSYNLSKSGFNIVSGLAKGVDSYSHIGTLAAKGSTIAVIGSGFDNIYPKENIELANKIILENGCILTEYPIGTKPEKNNFPARNRIISGISEATIIVEAKKKSGTIITADFALEQGRDVFVVPGNINSPNSLGTNNLIKEGACPITTYIDVLNELK